MLARTVNAIAKRPRILGHAVAADASRRLRVREVVVDLPVYTLRHCRQDADHVTVTASHSHMLFQSHVSHFLAIVALFEISRKTATHWHLSASSGCADVGFWFAD